MSMVRKLRPQLVESPTPSRAPAALQQALAYRSTPAAGMRKDESAWVDRVPDEMIDESVGMLDRASANVTVLLARFQQLEDYACKFEAWSKGQIAQAEGLVARTHEAALQAETELQAAQDRVEVERRRAELAEQAIARNGQTLNRLVERINTVFGSGSEADDAMQMIEAA